MSSSRFDHAPEGPPSSPTEAGDKSKKRKHSPVNTAPTDDEKECMLAKIAMEHYNKENSTHYEVVGAFLLSDDFILGGTWVHCNFAAWQPNGDMNAKSSSRLFFAELHGDDVTTCNWTVTACIVLEGNTTVGCSLCSKVIHPNHGFSQGHHKPKFPLQPHSPASCFSTSYLPTPEQLKPSTDELPKAMEPSILHRIHAQAALQLYNMKNGANYKLVDTLHSKDLRSDGSWFHCNFTAKPPNKDIAPKHFFAEIYSGDTYGVTPIACFILEEGQTTDRCRYCSEVIHPTHGFRSRVCNFSPAVYLPTWFQPNKYRLTSFQPATYSPTSNSLSMFLPTPEQLKHNMKCNSLSVSIIIILVSLNLAC